MYSVSAYKIERLLGQICYFEAKPYAPVGSTVAQW